MSNKIITIKLNNAKFPIIKTIRNEVFSKC